MSRQSFNSSLYELPSTATHILSHAGASKIFLFYGEMGAGKTTLIKELCAVLGVDEAVTSPTFSIVNEYRGSGNTIFHFDFYRLKTQSEALDMGYEEYFYSGAYCFIEWPEKIPDLLPEHYTRISLQVLSDTERQVTVENI
ncbi:MAG: tRNA (adenosine(37)-N6)-threonylcarbamoyltransferase complex ATPase subunit type 1 TsaE [Chitinophagaceae bacterium]|nr:MAG: tRNA (adenosine(37)-N6)-threonylcarbamoyltransferase complex ATPase subunit type 1 TsaE [Chitinophagaceae bacterium]